MTVHFTPRQIDAFLAVAELRSFRLAALRINVTSSGMSNLIAGLEASVGFPLFERTTRKVDLTPEGRRFMSSAEAVQRQIAQAAATAADIRGNTTEVVRIAAPLVVASVLLPRLTASLGTASKVRVRVIDTAVVWLIDRLAIGDADLAIGPDREVPSHMERVPLFPTPWVLWCRPDHMFAGAKSVCWSELGDIDLFAAGSDHEERIWPQLGERNPLRLSKRVQYVDHITTALGLAASGLGVTFSPIYVAPLAGAFGLVQRPLVDPEISRSLCLYARQDRGESEAISIVRTHILNSVDELMRQILGGSL
jgi:DNA-binding transcriptional LysR family regulator